MRTLFAPAFALALLSCKSDATSPTTTTTTPVSSVSVTPGSATLAVGTTQQFAAVAKDAQGNVLNGRSVTWNSSADAQVHVSTSGLATGAAPGSAAIVATIDGVANAATIVVAGAATQLFIGSGNNQTALTGTALPNPIVALVEDANNNVVPGVTVNWAAGAGGGTVASATTVTGPNGQAQVVWTLGAGGANGAAASVAGIGTVNFLATASVALFAPTAIAAGTDHSCGLSQSGAAYCWGANLVGALGDGTLTARLVPTAVSGGFTFASIVAGNSTCALTAVGKAYCWGYNRFGQVGDGSTTDRTAPVAVATTMGFKQIAAGWNHHCALTSDGVAYCWGANGNGDLGNGGSAESYPTLVAVSGGLRFNSIGAGNNTTCALTTAGAAYCWGFANALGNGGGNDSRVPVAVAGGRTFTQLGTGLAHSCGLTATGQAYCWGTAGLGAGGTTFASLTPLLVTGGISFASIVVGGDESCGLTAAHVAYCWGRNGNGTVGDGTQTPRYAPVPVAGGLTWSTLELGNDHACGRATDGALYCWGGNANGVLGDGTTTVRLVPTRVSGNLP